MPSPLVIAQFARIVGREALMEWLGLPAGSAVPDALSDEQCERALGLAADRADQVAHALLDEAMASDDIQDERTAAAYLHERLAFFAPLLTDATRSRIREEFLRIAGRWG